MQLKKKPSFALVFQRQQFDNGDRYAYLTMYINQQCPQEHYEELARCLEKLPKEINRLMNEQKMPEDLSKAACFSLFKAQMNVRLIWQGKYLQKLTHYVGPYKQDQISAYLQTNEPQGEFLMLNGPQTDGTRPKTPGFAGRLPIPVLKSFEDFEKLSEDKSLTQQNAPIIGILRLFESLELSNKSEEKLGSQEKGKVGENFWKEVSHISTSIRSEQLYGSTLQRGKKIERSQGRKNLFEP